MFNNDTYGYTYDLTQGMNSFKPFEDPSLDVDKHVRMVKGFFVFEDS